MYIYRYKISSIFFHKELAQTIFLVSICGAKKEKRPYFLKESKKNLVLSSFCSRFMDGYLP